MDYSQIISLILVTLCVVTLNAEEQNNRSRQNIRNNFIKVRGGRSEIRRQNGRQILAKRKTENNNDNLTSAAVDPVLIKDLHQMFKEVDEKAHLDVDTNIEEKPTSKNIKQLQSGSHRFAIPGIRQPTNQRSIDRKRENDRSVQKVTRFPNSESRIKLVEESRKTNLESRGKLTEESRKNVNLESKGQQTKFQAQHIKSNLSLRPRITGRRGEYSRISKQNKKPSNVHIRIKPKINNLSGRVFPTTEPPSDAIKTTDMSINKKPKAELPETPRISNFEGAQSYLFRNRFRLNFENLSRTGRPAIKIDLPENPIQEPVQHILPVKRKRPKGNVQSKTKVVVSLGGDNAPLLDELDKKEQTIGLKQKKVSKKISKEKMMKLSEKNRQIKNRSEIRKKGNVTLEIPVETKENIGRQKVSLGSRKFIDPRKNSVKGPLTIATTNSPDQTTLELEQNNQNVFKRRKFVTKKIVPTAESEMSEPLFIKMKKKGKSNILPKNKSEIKELTHKGGRKYLFKRIKPLEQSKLSLQQSEVDEPRNRDKILKRRKSLKFGKTTTGQTRSEKNTQDNSSLIKTRFGVGQINARKFRQQGIRQNIDPVNHETFSVLKKSSVESSTAQNFSTKSDFLDGEEGSKKLPLRITRRKHVPSKTPEFLVNGRISTKRRGTKRPKLNSKGTSETSDGENESNAEINNIINDSTGRKISSQFRHRKPILNNELKSRDNNIINNSGNRKKLVTNTGIKRSRPQSVPELDVINAQTGPRQQVRRKQKPGKKLQGQQESVSIKESGKRQENIQNESNLLIAHTVSEQFKKRRPQLSLHGNTKSTIKSIKHDSIKDRTDAATAERTKIQQKNISLKETNKQREHTQNERNIPIAHKISNQLKRRRPQISMEQKEHSSLTEKTEIVKKPRIEVINETLEVDSVTTDRTKIQSEDLLERRNEIDFLSTQNRPKLNHLNLPNVLPFTAFNWQSSDDKKEIKENESKSDIQTNKIFDQNNNKMQVNKSLKTETHSKVRQRNLQKNKTSKDIPTVSENVRSHIKFKELNLQLRKTQKNIQQKNKHFTSPKRFQVDTFFRNTTPTTTLGFQDSIPFQTNSQRSPLNNKGDSASTNNPDPTTIKTIQQIVSQTSAPRFTLGNRKSSFFRTNSQRNIPVSSTEKIVQPNLTRNTTPRTTLGIKTPIFSRTNIIKNIIKTLSPKDNSKHRNEPSGTTSKTTESNPSRKTTQTTTSKVQESIITTRDIAKYNGSNILEETDPIIIGTTEIYHLPIIKQNKLPEELIGSPTELTPYTVDVALKHAQDTWEQDPYRDQHEQVPEKVFDIDYSKDPDPDFDNAEETNSIIPQADNQHFSQINHEQPTKQKTQISVKKRRKSRENGSSGHIKQPKTLSSEIRNQQINIPGIDGKPLMDQIFILEEYGSSVFNKNRARG